MNPRSDSASADFAPSWARKVWADAEAIYLEIPARSGPPLIQRYAKSDGGLAKAIDLICLAFKREPKAPSRFVAKAGPLVTKPKSDFTDEQRAAAAKVLRKLGLSGR